PPSLRPRARQWSERSDNRSVEEEEPEACTSAARSTMRKQLASSRQILLPRKVESTGSALGCFAIALLGDNCLVGRASRQSIRRLQDFFQLGHVVGNLVYGVFVQAGVDTAQHIGQWLPALIL